MIIAFACNVKIYSSRITTKGRYGHAFENLLHTRPIEVNPRSKIEQEIHFRTFLKING